MNISLRPLEGGRPLTTVGFFENVSRESPFGGNVNGGSHLLEPVIHVFIVQVALCDQRLLPILLRCVLLVGPSG